MSRATRKLMKQREIDEMEKLANENKGDEEKAAYRRNQPKNVFAMITDSSSSGSEQEEELQVQDEAVQERDGAELIEDEKLDENEVKEDILEVEVVKEEEKKKKRKNKKKKKKAKKTDEEEVIVAENDGTTEIYSKSTLIYKIDVLEIQKLNLNYNKELSSFFKGARLVDAPDEGNLTKKQKAMMKQRRNLFKPKKKYYLVHNEDVYAPLPDKLILEHIKTNQYGHNVYAFKTSPIILKLSETYEGIRNTHDPQNLNQFIQANPFYPEALYDFAEYLRLGGQAKDANRLLEQLLFLYEESFSYEFQLFESSFKERHVLDFNFNRYTRIFFRAIFKMISILTTRGCYKSALEYNKLLLRLNPSQDPLGAMLYIDHCAISARKFDFLLDFAFHFGDQYLRTSVDGPKSILLYPNILYSIALSKFFIELKELEKIDNVRTGLSTLPESFEEDIINLNIHKEQGSHFWIALAVTLYPSILQKLLELTELDKQNESHSKFKNMQVKPWRDILSHPLMMRYEDEYHYFFLGISNDEDIEGIKKVCQIYPERNKLVWKHKMANIWLKAAVGGLLNGIESNIIDSDLLLEHLTM